MPTSSESQHPISGAPSHQEDPALPQMQDIFLDLRSLFPPGLHYLFHVPLDSRLPLAICHVLTVLAFYRILW